MDSARFVSIVVLLVALLFGTSRALPKLPPKANTNDPVLQRVLGSVFAESAVGEIFDTGDDTQWREPLSETDLTKLRYAFRGLDFTRSQFGRMLETGETGAAFWRETTESLNAELADDNLQATLLDLLTEYAGKRTRDLDREPFIQSDEDRGQETGYEGCRRDYSSAIEPITDRILYLINVIVCEQLPPLACQIAGIADPEPPERNMTSWGWQMFDALAKLPTGLTDGKLHWVGSYEMCEDITAEYTYHNTSYGQTGQPVEERVFKGQYCRLHLMRENSSLTLQYGACVPDTCTQDDVYQYIMEENMVMRLFIGLIGFNITYVYCGQDLDPGTDTDLQVTIAICGICIVLVLLATLYDGFLRIYFLKHHIEPLLQGTPVTMTTAGAYANMAPPSLDGLANEKADYKPDNPLSAKSTHGSKPVLSSQSSTASTNALIASYLSVYEQTDEKPTWKQRLEMAFVGFSGYSNMRRIFTTKQDNDKFDVLNGIRVLSFFWVILGHTYLLGPVYSESWVTSNLLRAVTTLPQQLSFQHIINFHYAVDSFLVISGTLTTYWWLKHHEDTKFTYKSVLYYILHRYWRIMPTYMLIVMFYMSTYRYLAAGPMFPADIEDAENCKSNWWVNLLLVQNLVNTHEQCLAWSWYLSMLFQLHVFTLIVLIPLVMLPLVGYGLLAAMYLAHIGATAGVTAEIYNGSRISNFGAWYTDYLCTPWCRAGPYCVGLALGIILVKSKCKIKMSWWIALIGWLLALICIFVPVYVTYDILQEDGNEWTDAGLVAYDTLCRSMFGLGIAWIIFACITGYGGVVTPFLSMRVFQPLSKLVMCAMIPHALLIYKYYYSLYQLLYIDAHEMVHLCMAHIWVIFIVGVIVALLFQYPLSVGLEKALLCDSKKTFITCGRHPLEGAEELAKANPFTPQGASVYSGENFEPPTATGDTMLGATTAQNGGMTRSDSGSVKHRSKHNVSAPELNRMDSVTKF